MNDRLQTAKWRHVTHEPSRLFPDRMACKHCYSLPTRWLRATPRFSDAPSEARRVRWNRLLCPSFYSQAASGQEIDLICQFPLTASSTVSLSGLMSLPVAML